MKIAIISSEDFNPVYMVKNYIDAVKFHSRPFAGYDAEYDEHITFMTGVNTLIDAVGSVKASMEGFDVKAVTPKQEPNESKRNRMLIEEADKVIFFWNNKNDNVKRAIDFALSIEKTIEVYFDKTGKE